MGLWRVLSGAVEGHYWGCGGCLVGLWRVLSGAVEGH